jgi:hypothetical protein
MTLPDRPQLEPPDDAPEVDAVPVLAEPAVVERRAAAPVATQAAVVAATSFVAGMATIAVVCRRRFRRVLSGRRRRRELGRVVASRSFLVDVHVLGDRK